MIITDNTKTQLTFQYHNLFSCDYAARMTELRGPRLMRNYTMKCLKTKCPGQH